jgi:flagellar biosynthetic protein FliQ
MSFFDDAFLQAMYLLGFGLGLPLGVLLVIGLFLAVFQSATQVQEQLLSFFPKIGVGFLLLYLGGNRFLGMSSEYLKDMIFMLSQVK